MKKRALWLAIIPLIAIVSGCSAADNTTTTNTEQSSATSQETKEQKKEKDNVDFSDLSIDLEKAISLFQETYPGADLTSVELSKNFGTIHYKMEGLDDSQEHKLRINSETGEIDRKRSSNIDWDDNLRREHISLDVASLLPISDIVKSALDSRPDGEVTDMQLERETGNAYWEVEVSTGTLSHVTMDIDAQSGEVLSTKRD